jgi:glycosyltransferase involved in cell wall biosynthesis
VTVVAFPFHDWRKSEAEGFRTRDAHLLQTLASHPDVAHVLVIDRPTSVPELVRRRRLPFVRGRREARKVVRRTVGQVTAVGGGVSVLDVLSPAIIKPLLRRRAWWFDAFEDRDVLALIAWAARRLPATGRVLAVAWTPTVAPALERLDVDVVFDSLDNWLIHPTLRQHARQAIEGYQRILPRAAAVFASGPASVTVLSRWSRNVQLLQNGVDPEAFKTPGRRPRDMPDGPVVLYAGKLADRIDAELIDQVAARLPTVRFLFVGPVLQLDVQRRLGRRHNVQVLGDRPYEQIPSYLFHADLTWIPHRVGEGETGGDPIKMYEAWAAGRQVITTPIDGIQAWERQLFVVDSADAAVETIGGLLDGTIAPKPVSVPEERTWASIADVLVRSVAE